MTILVKVMQIFGFAVAIIIVLLIALSIVANQLPQTTTDRTTVTQIEPQQV